MQTVEYVKKIRYWFVISCIAAGLLCVNALCADLDRPQLLRELSLSSGAVLNTRAGDISVRQPEDTRKLTLDLIFYWWANEKYEMDPGVDGLDRITAALVSVSFDPAVGWAAGALGSRDWVTSTPAPETDNQYVKLLSDARNSLRTALDLSVRSPSRSIASLKSCADVLDSLDLKLSYAFVTARLAERQLNAAHRYRDAEASYERAHPIFTAYGLRAQVAQIFDNLGKLHNEVGRYGAAKDNYNASAQEWQVIGRGDLAGKQFVNAGLAIDSDGKLDSALSTMKHGLEISGKYARDATSNVSYTQLLLEVASFCSKRDLHAEARDLLIEADNAAERAGDSLLQAMVLKNLATVWKSLGFEPEANECLIKRDELLNGLVQEGIDAAEKLADPLLSVSDQSALLSTAEKGAEACAALGKYDQGVKILKLVVNRYATVKRDKDQVRALRGLAVNYDGQGKHNDAVIVRSQAASIAKSIGNRVLVIDILKEIEEAARESGDNQTALEALRELVDLVPESEDVLARANMLEARGTLLYNMGQYDEAIQDLSKVVSIYTDELGEPWSQARARMELAAAQSESDETDDAIESLSTGIQRIEDWANIEGIDPSSDPSHADMLYNLYSSLIGLEVSEKRQDDAIRWLRKARIYTWFGRLRSNLTALGDPTATAALKALDRIPDDNQVNLPVNGTRKVASGWSNVITQAVPFSRLARRDREFDSVGTIDAVDIYKVRSRLADGLTLIEYAISDTSVCALVATKDTASYWELPASSEQIREAVQSLRGITSELEKQVASGIPVPPVKNWRDQALIPILDPLYSLSGMLIDPLRGELSKTTMIAFILPDDLTGVPFHALPRGNRDNLSFLIQQYAVSYVAPGTLDALIRTNRTPITGKKGKVAIFADSSGKVPGATAEANRIRSFYGKNSNLYTGVNSTAEKFVAAASWANIVHIATHHKLDPNPAQFALVLSEKPGETGAIRINHIMRIKNPALELIVLSACETISTSDVGSAGAPYTAEIFALAGFPSVIGGLWKVSDSSARELMQIFYENLSSVGKKAVALQRAERYMIESKGGNFAHPFYWASFALYGDPR